MNTNATEVMERLRSAGYEAYLVGGCVRDLLLGRTPKDFDVTTNALPEQVQGLFPRTIPVGAKFGVVVVLSGDEQIEVATYRTDGVYSDGRRPDTVEYGKSAQEDVERRDFTINGLLCVGSPRFGEAEFHRAVADRYVTVGGETYGIVDYVGGYRDIERKTIRAIGDPNKRFEEDALRMIRAVRFAAQIGFSIEEDTLKAIAGNARLLKAISRERVAMELFRMLSAPEPLKGIVPFFSTGLFRHALPEGFDTHVNMARTLQRFGTFGADKDPMLGMAMLFADIDDMFCEKLAPYLKLSAEQRDELVYSKHHAARFRQHLSGTCRMTEATIKRQIRKPGVELALDVMTQDEVMGKTSFGVEALMAFVLKVKAYTPEQIKPAPLVTGKDLIDAGIPAGPIFSEILYDAESHQLNGLWTTKKEAMDFVRERVYVDNAREWVYMGLSTAEVRELE